VISATTSEHSIRSIRFLMQARVLARLIAEGHMAILFVSE